MCLVAVQLGGAARHLRAVGLPTPATTATGRTQKVSACPRLPWPTLLSATAKQRESPVQTALNGNSVLQDEVAIWQPWRHTILWALHADISSASHGNVFSGFPPSHLGV